MEGRPGGGSYVYHKLQVYRVKKHDSMGGDQKLAKSEVGTTVQCLQLYSNKKATIVFFLFSCNFVPIISWFQCPAFERSLLLQRVGNSFERKAFSPVSRPPLIKKDIFI